MFSGENPSRRDWLGVAGELEPFDVLVGVEQPDGRELPGGLDGRQDRAKVCRGPMLGRQPHPVAQRGPEEWLDDLIEPGEGCEDPDGLLHPHALDRVQELERHAGELGGGPGGQGRAEGPGGHLVHVARVNGGVRLDLVSKEVEHAADEGVERALVRIPEAVQGVAGRVHERLEDRVNRPGRGPE